MTFEKIPYKIYLTEDEMPMNWYNVRGVRVQYTLAGQAL